MTRTEQKIALLQRIYDFVAANPGVSSIKICEFLHVSRSSGRPWLRIMTLGEHLISTPGKKSNMGALPDTFQIGASGRPTKAPAKIRKDTEKAEIPFRRRVVPAVQIGMIRDSLVAALFGLPKAAA
jgi:hypothetical protein